MINVNYKFAKEKMFNGEDHNHLQVNVEVKNKVKNKRKQPVALMLCVDRSGSMGSSLNGNYGYSSLRNNHAGFGFNSAFVGHNHVLNNNFEERKLYSKMDYVKKAAVDILHSLDDEDYFGIVIFDDYAYSIIELSQVGKNKLEMVERIRKIEPKGSTNMYDGLLAVEREYLKLENKDVLKKTIVLSDGQVNVGKRELNDFIEKSEDLFKNKNISISTIGFGSDYNLEYMSVIANKGEGNFYHLKESDEIFKIIEEELNTINLVVGSNAEIQIKIPIGFSFEENLNNFNEEYIDNIIKIKLGNLHTNKSILFPIHLLKKIDKEEVITSLSLKYVDENNQNVTIDKELIFKITNDKTTIQENKALVKDISRTIQNQAILKATIEFENSGSFANSTSSLNESYSTLSSSYNYVSLDATSYSNEFQNIVASNSGDINAMRNLNAKSMTEIKNRK